MGNPESGVAKYDFLDSMVSTYESALVVFVEFLSHSDRLISYTNSLTKGGMWHSIVDIIRNSSGRSAYVAFENILLENVWKYIFNHMNLGKYMTKDVQTEFNKF